MKKWRYFLLIHIFCYLLNICPFASAAAEGPVEDWAIDGKSITVSGSGENVSIFLLNPGKTVADLNASEDLDEFNEAVNYTAVVNADGYGEYSVTFRINAGYEAAAYLLYVKDKTGEFSASVEYAGLDALKIYVSQSAESGGDGTEEKPFQAVTEARDYIRTIDKTCPIEVIISGGVYKLDETIEFAAEDSGTIDAPITYKAASGEEVIFSGAREIAISDTVKKVEDGNILGRVSKAAAENLVEIDLAANNVPEVIADYLAIHTADGAGKGYNAKTPGIYLNDVRQSVARWPNSGYKGTTQVSTTDKTLKIKDSDDRISRWAKAENMYIEGYFRYDWYGQWAQVSGVDTETGKITLSYTPTHGLINDYGRAAVVNLLEELDIPGEWYIDADSMKLYYYPPHELTADDTLEICVLNQNFVTLEKCEYINFEGLTFEKNADSPDVAADAIARGNGIFIRESSDISVKNCVFKHTGMDSIYLLWSSLVDIESCVIYDTGLRGIFIKGCGDTGTLLSSDITISDSYISTVSRDSGRNSSAGIYIDADSVGVTVVNNTICNMKNSAIRYGGNLHTIKNNEIYNCVMETADAGAIYSGRSFVQYGTVIKNNHFHKIGSELSSNGVGAVFWDDNHSGNTFTGNIVDISNVDNAAGIRIGGGRDNIITGNVFVNGDAIRGADRTVNPTADAYDATDSSNFYNEAIFQSFKIATSPQVENAYYITDEDWNSAYSSKFKNILVNFDELRNQQKYTRLETIKGNIVTGAITLDESMTNDSIVSDNITPEDMDIFVDADGGNYRLTDEYFSQISEISDEFITESFADTIGLNGALPLKTTDTAFSLIYPSDNSVVYGEDVTLNWSKCYFANAYKYEVSDTEDFSNPVASGETRDSCVVIENLEKDKTYYWRVTGCNNSSYLDYEVSCEDVYSFTLNSGIYVSALDYDKATSTISCTLINDTAADKAEIIFVAALKDKNGSLIEIKTTEGEAKTSGPVTTAVDAGFTKSGDAVELFVFESLGTMRPYAIKYIFEK